MFCKAQVKKAFEEEVARLKGAKDVFEVKEYGENYYGAELKDYVIRDLYIFDKRDNWKVENGLIYASNYFVGSDFMVKTRSDMIVELFWNHFDLLSDEDKKMSKKEQRETKKDFNYEYFKHAEDISKSFNLSLFDLLMTIVSKSCDLDIFDTYVYDYCMLKKKFMEIL